MSMESIKYTVTGFCRCFAFRIGKTRGHNGIIRNFQFRKFLPVKSNPEFSLFMFPLRYLYFMYCMYIRN